MENEIWKDIEGFEGVYKVSNKGRVMSFKYSREKVLRNAVTNGREFVRLLKNGSYHCFHINRLVATTFLPNPENKAQVNHINGIKIDNRVENLEWCTHSENIKHAIENKLIVHEKGENHQRSLLKEKDVISIRQKKVMGAKYIDLSKEYNVSIGCIQGIVERRNWTHI